jgi:hypothetical protein
VKKTRQNKNESLGSDTIRTELALAVESRMGIHEARMGLAILPFASLCRRD